ncbi:cellulose biosynthesis protein BcsG [Pseudomonas sp. NC26]|uniref:Cellulose biosynthesis protein BcsG n=1 Tax=Pseudomonas putida TaxID=303 RepID=A0A7W2KXH2_PSEPU|nr:MULTISPECIES: cellulose biosynthesis protein BcsG [Pseudomonas]MBA6114502.1 cellulose biosynthesis protein BcsG [Pseudomonas putida]MCZ9640285.1 cellulose biosynthesis protein BcsG [Pseudomonas putida]MEC4879319.1 cellulose biosynthesis protein BcsG [Pseudomonas sp. NC26]PZQ37263.1 MAG: cellulose biosynthesis protein BcsG [Pseudomonas putida]QNL85608.1 Cellulose biosynthesis protein BcsG [Pseudomonas putida]
MTSLTHTVPGAAAWRGLGAWNLYFLAKFLLVAIGTLDFQALPNLLFAAFLLVPLPLRWVRIVRQVVAVPLGVALFYHDTWLPPFRRLLEQPGVFDFSWHYLLELMARFVNWNLMGALVLLLVGYLFLRHWLRLSTLSLVGLAWLTLGGLPSLSAPGGQQAVGGVAATASTAAVADNATLNAWLERFFASERQRVTSFPVVKPDEQPFDLLIINVCSLAWDDLSAVGMHDNALFSRMDVVFDQFNSATSYSGPAAIRVLRASCGQSSHSGLYQPAPEQCLLFQNLDKLGFQSQTLLNHSGRFDNFIGDITSQHMPQPGLSASDFPRALVSFDGSPIAGDLDVLRGWWGQRKNLAAQHVSLFYNTISLHDGNRVVTADGGTRAADYATRANRLFADLGKFLDDLEGSGRRVVVAIVPEHGAALHGDRMQLSGMREIPTPSITHVPVGLKFIGMGQHVRSEPLRVTSPTSFLALSELVSRVYAGLGAGQTLDLPSLLTDLPTTERVSETSGAQVLDYQGRTYMRLQGQPNWQPVPKESP